MALLDRTYLGKTCKGRRLDAIELVVVHRSGVGSTAEELAKWFSDNPQYTGGKPPYHVFIRADGTKELLVRLGKIAPGAIIANKTGVQVALEGDFRKHSATPEQATALKEVCLDLCGFIGSVNIEGHDEIDGARADPNKACPGKCLNMDGLRSLVTEYFEPWPEREALDRLKEKGWVI
jgi:hypothetical protein